MKTKSRLFAWPPLRLSILSIVALFFTFLMTTCSPNPNITFNLPFGDGGGNDSIDIGWSVQQTSDGGYVIAGDASSGAVYLVKTDASGNEMWEKTFGGVGVYYGRSVQQTSDDGYVIAGVVSNTTVSIFSASVYLVKTDASGNKMWEKTFGGTDRVSGNSVRQASDGGYIIVGTISSSSTYTDTIYLIKTDVSGNAVWEKTFGGLGSASGNSIQQTSDGGYIIAGQTFSPSNTSTTAVYLVKTDASGNSVWEKTFGGVDVYFGQSVQQTIDGGYVIAGYTRSSSTGYNDVYLIKTDTSGGAVWLKTLGGPFDDMGNSVRQASDGGYIIAGYTRSSGAGYGDVYLIRTDVNGNTVWQKIFGGNLDAKGNAVQLTSDNGYIIVGYKETSSTDYVIEAYLIKTDASGNTVWEKTFGSNK